MKSAPQILAAGLLSLTLLFTGEMAMAKSHAHKKAKATHSQKHAKAKAKKKKKHSAGLPEKRSSGYAKASGYMSSRKPANASHKHKGKAHSKKHKKHH